MNLPASLNVPTSANKDILLPPELDKMRITNVPDGKDDDEDTERMHRKDCDSSPLNSRRKSKSRDIRLRLDPLQGLSSLQHHTHLRRDISAGSWSDEQVWTLIHRKLTRKYDENIFNHFQRCCAEMALDTDFQGILDDLDDLDDFDDIVPNSRIMDYLEETLNWNECEQREFIQSIKWIIGEKTKYHDPFAETKRHSVLRADFGSQRPDDEIWKFIERRLMAIYPAESAKDIVAEYERHSRMMDMDFQDLLDDVDDYFDPDQNVDSVMLQYLQAKFRWSDDRVQEFAVVIRKLLADKVKNHSVSP